jgi:hypothetical protein
MVNGVHTDAIRVLRRHQDAVIILLPVDRVGGQRSGPPLGHQLLCVVSGVRTANTSNGAGIRKAMSATQVCGGLDELRSTGIRGGVTAKTGTFVGALVPDRVARVVVRLRDNRTVSATVRDNYYEVPVGAAPPPAWGVRWLDANGHIVDHRR